MTDNQRKHLRRIAVLFAVVVILIPIAMLQGAASLALVPALVAAYAALREAVALRRSTRLDRDDARVR